MARSTLGHVEEVGKNVKRFKPGDTVIGSCNDTLAEYACATEDSPSADHLSRLRLQHGAVGRTGIPRIRGPMEHTGIVSQ